MPQSRVGLWLTSLDRAGRVLENALMVGLLLVMLGVAVAQITLRNFFDSGLIWSDEFLRLTVLWIALLGSMAAARDHRHLRIDILSRLLSPTGLRISGFIVDIFTAAICGILAYYSYLFVAEAREYEDLAFGTRPLWWFQTILPIGFAVMTLRYLTWSVRQITGHIARQVGQR
ncbi:MAG: TRAP transporter small permease [Gammaproteobacteria bacterium]|nr:TRAP transporter small permease [Gammaproteobacteria bacterium]